MLNMWKKEAKERNRLCCVIGCPNRYSNSDDVVYYSFPTRESELGRRRKWVLAVNRKNPDGSLWEPSQYSRICSAHFLGNRKSGHLRNPAFVPTLFPKEYIDNSVLPDKTLHFNPEHRSSVIKTSVTIDPVSGDIPSSSIDACVGTDFCINASSLDFVFTCTFEGKNIGTQACIPLNFCLCRNVSKMDECCDTSVNSEVKSIPQSQNYVSVESEVDLIHDNKVASVPDMTIKEEEVSLSDGEIEDQELLENAQGNSCKTQWKIIPSKSEFRYKKEYNGFCEWKNENGVDTVTEEVMLTFMSDLSKTMVSSSLWSKYSMIKSMLLLKENIDISKFTKLREFLKQRSVGYQPTQSKTLTREEINLFLREASDEDHLLMKVVAMMGIAGGCRRDELYEMTTDDIIDAGTQLIVTIPHTKNNLKRMFSVTNEDNEVDFLELFRKYVALRPALLSHKYIFVGFRKGRCTCQRVGINTIGGIPKKIAQFLGLPNPETYTGHCFRRTSATFIYNSAGDNILKRQEDVNFVPDTYMKRQGECVSSIPNAYI